MPDSKGRRLKDAVDFVAFPWPRISMNEQEFDALVRTTRLSAKSREVARLVAVEGLSQSEAASSAGLSTVRVSQIMTTLKKAEAERQNPVPSTSVDLVRASFAVAVKEARDRYGDEASIKTPEATGKFIGNIEARTDFHLVQHVGRNSVVIHDLSVLDRVPPTGKSVSIEYAGGRATVRDRGADREGPAPTR